MELTFDLGPGDERLFIDESLEQIERIESGLLELERGDASAATVNEVFRAAHTLKGSAATIRHARMAELTHAMEDVFGALRSGTIREIGPFADIVLSTIDVLRALVEEVTVGHTLTDAPDALTRQLRAALAEATDAGQAPGASGHGPGAAAPGGSKSAVPEGAHRAASAVPARPRGDAALERLLREAPDLAGPSVIVRCSVDPACEWQGVRLFQALMEATESGLLLASVPTSDEIEAGLSNLDLALLLRGPEDEVSSTVDRIRAVDDMASVSVEPTAHEADSDPIPAQAGSTPQAAASAEPAGSTATETPAQEATERRRMDLGVEARGLAGEERVAVAGDRLRLAQQTIRIDVGRLDELMNLVGELVVQKTRLQLQAQRLMSVLGDDPLARDAESGAQQFARIAGQIQDQVTGLRMLPIETVFNRFPRVVRDLGAKLGRDVELVVEGGETELDRSVLEEVGDPLGHLVRNALDHGIEPPEVRAAAGKQTRGRLRLSARHAEGMIVITVEDDGAGMDAGDLRRKATEKGLLSTEAAAALSDADALKIIFLPGFSTAARVTDVSGRGVGMDVVRTNIERLGGRVEVVSAKGAGTQIVLSLPLTLAIVGAMLVRSGERICALPLTGVVETLRVQPASISRIQGHPMLTLRGRVVPVAVLDDALGDPPRPLEGNERGFVNMVVVRSRQSELALAVDEFVGQQEIVLKSMSVFTGRLRGISGATILADGTVALVVDIPALFEGSPRGRAAA